MTRTLGFTLVELLVIMLILGLLVAIALPRFARSREKAARAAMQSDLRNLVTAQEAYFEKNFAYTNTMTDLQMNISPSVILEIVEVNGNGWSAKATHENTVYECAVYFGAAAPPAGTTLPDEGIVGCT
jgi:type II secretory pathway pseudopilin PulG